MESPYFLLLCVFYIIVVAEVIMYEKEMFYFFFPVCSHLFPANFFFCNIVNTFVLCVF